MVGGFVENVSVDKSGRFVIPKKVRAEFDTNVFSVEVEKDAIVLRPKKGLRGLFGTFPDLDMKEFEKWKREEVERENSS
jgi:bifunctional DNA-binding transcriptional regulator/antitoxin component of YhaV-PrlF toxin-antitoxin module